MKHEQLYCRGCFEKQRRIDQLEEENKSLKSKLKYQEKKQGEGYFGSSTPSSKKPFKENSKEDTPMKNGGAKEGHKGYGRKSISKAEADEVEYLSVKEDRCPKCKGKLESKGSKARSIIDSILLKARKLLYQCEEKHCPRCKITISNKPVILPKSMYGNQLITQAAVMHCIHGIPAGKIVKMFGKLVTEGGLFKVFDKLGKMFEKTKEAIIREYRKEQIKHADETGWRTDGQNGYAWIFCSEKTSIFEFRNSRSGKIASEILGKGRLLGTLCVDRYQGYNRLDIEMQYCYSHLLREVEDLGEEFSDNDEVQSFVNTLSDFLSEAIRLRRIEINNKEYYRRAKIIRKKILKTIRSPCQHLGIKRIQNIFLKNEKKLYHWVKDRNVPADNNLAERELRSVVIARKVSFGSQSINGAKTRGILMTVLLTAQKRLKDRPVEEWFKDTLDKIALNPDIKINSLLPKP